MINFEAALKALSERGVNFVVIGGYAATLHGSAYLTRDFDICTSARRKTWSGWCPHSRLILRVFAALQKGLFFLTCKRFLMA